MTVTVNMTNGKRVTYWNVKTMQHDIVHDHNANIPVLILSFSDKPDAELLYASEVSSIHRVTI